MTGTEYQAIRDSLKMSRERLASALGITASTVFRRERGGDSIPPEAEAAILRFAESREAETPESVE